jgi:hypothetical protein
MDVVIKISEEAYNTLKTKGSIDYLNAKHILNAVINGTPLPKGHSDLVYRDDILASFVAARAELSGEFDEGLHEAWEIVNSEDATPAIIKGERSDS